MKTMAMDPAEELYRSEHQRLWKSLLAFVGDPDIAAEAESEAFRQALSRGDQLRDPKAWLWRSAFKIAKGLLAAKRTRPQPENFTEGHAVEGIQDMSVSFDSAMIDFLGLLTTLSDQQRAVVVLRYAGGYKPGEIAELLDTSSGSVRVQLHRAHQHLREKIGNQ